MLLVHWFFGSHASASRSNAGLGRSLASAIGQAGTAAIAMPNDNEYEQTERCRQKVRRLRYWLDSEEQWIRHTCCEYRGNARRRKFQNIVIQHIALIKVPHRIKGHTDWAI